MPQTIQDWPLYMAPAGSTYTIGLEPETPSIGPDMRLIKRYYDSRPNVAVIDARRDGSRVYVDVRVFKDSSLISLLGNYVNDGEQFWETDTVVRTDAGDLPGAVELTARRWLDALSDPVERFGSDAATAAVETAKTVGKIAIPTTLVGGAIALFILTRKG